MTPLLRLRRRCLTAFVCVSFALAAPAARALSITIDEQDRSVAAEASAATAAANDAAADADETQLPGVASLVANAVAAVDGANGAASATQQGDVATSEITGEASVSSFSSASAADGFALARSEARLRIVFTATTDSLVRLTGRIAALGDGSGDASALIELAAVDSTLDPLLLLFEVAPGEEFDIDAIAMLHTGIEYRLLALARSDSDALAGEGDPLFASMFRFALTEVPEPGTALTLLLGLALLAARAP